MSDEKKTSVNEESVTEVKEETTDEAQVEKAELTEEEKAAQKKAQKEAKKKAKKELKAKAKAEGKTLWGEFKTFISRGNVVDMAVGVAVAGAFTAIVTAFTKGFVSPIIALLSTETTLNDLKWVLREAYTTEAGVEVAEVAILWGAFLQTLLDFMIIAAVFFLALKIFHVTTQKARLLREKIDGTEKAKAAAKAEAEAKKKEEEEAAALKAKEEAEKLAKEEARKEEEIELLRRIAALLEGKNNG